MNKKLWWRMAGVGGWLFGATCAMQTIAGTWNMPNAAVTLLGGVSYSLVLAWLYPRRRETIAHPGKSMCSLQYVPETNFGVGPHTVSGTIHAVFTPSDAVMEMFGSKVGAIDRYTCDQCRRSVVTEQMDVGKAPFSVSCLDNDSGCEGTMHSAGNNVDQTLNADYELVLASWPKNREPTPLDIQVNAMCLLVLRPRGLAGSGPT